MLRVKFPLSALALSLWACVFLVASTPATAESKIAVIDVEKVVAESSKGKQGRADMEKLREQKQSELAGKRQEILDLKKRLEGGSLSLAPEKLASLQEEYEEKVLDLRRAEDDANRDLQKRGEKLMGDIERQILPVIQQVGQDQGFTLIFNKYQSGLLFADDSVDITEKVIEALNQVGASNG